METDNKNVGILPIGFTVLNMNILVNTIGCDYIGNNHHNGGYTIVGNNKQIQNLKFNIWTSMT